MQGGEIMDFIEKFFKLKENNTNIKTEMIAGISTFMTMAYILAVNPSILSATGMDAGAIFTATAISSALACLFMAFFSNYPFALAPAMGPNAFFAYTVVKQMGYSWETALAAVFIEGILFLILSLTKVRKAIFNCIPFSLKLGISGGVALFIAFIGLVNAHIITAGPTIVQFFPFHKAIAEGTMRSMGTGVILAVAGTLITALLMKHKVKGSILFGIFITWILGMICQLAGLYIPDPQAGMMSVIPAFKANMSVPSLSPLFLKMDFSSVLSLNFISIVFAFMFVDIFDTLGTLIGIGAKSGFLDSEGHLDKMNGALLADSLGTICGAMLGTSTVSTYVESSAGTADGGRTGLTACFVALLFILSLPFASVFLSVPSFATAPALIVVGFMIFSGVKINFENMSEGFPAYIAMLVMPLSYSISDGIACGVISYTALNLFSPGDRKKLNPVIYVLSILFVLKYFFF